MAQSPPYHIIFEDPDFLIINKSSGLPVIPDRYRPEAPNLRDLLSESYGQIFIVHRLDADTSGVMVVAKTAAMHRHLSLQFQNHDVRKTYLGLIEGMPGQPDFTIDKPIEQAGSGRMRVNPKGKPAITHVTVIEAFRHFSLVEIHTEQGRTHQIRVHLQSIGHPLVADPIYGLRQGLTILDIKGQKANLPRSGEVRPLIARAALHASTLIFTSMIGKSFEFSATLPKDFEASLKQLRRWQS
jgi:RluA family pseudouridine synthase